MVHRKRPIKTQKKKSAPYEEMLPTMDGLMYMDFPLLVNNVGERTLVPAYICRGLSQLIPGGWKYIVPGQKRRRGFVAVYYIYQCVFFGLSQ